jgi:hypothetical protein
LFGWRKGIAAIRIFMRHNSTRLSLGMPLEEEYPARREPHLLILAGWSIILLTPAATRNKAFFAQEGPAGNTCNEDRFSLY